MTVIRRSILVRSLVCLGGAVCLAATAAGQVQVLSVAEARQILAPHLDPPDTAFGDRVVIETSLEGHPEYLFYGNAWGRYRINAVTRAKLIQHQGRTLLEPGVQPATTLDASALRQTAVDYVATHYPDYQPGMFQVWSPETVTADDCNEFTVAFSAQAPSGAELPPRCVAYVEEDTGAVKTYEECCLPTLVNTWPSVTEAQAVAAGRQWIALNCDPDPYWGELLTPGDLHPIEFMVDVDPLLNQALVYRIPYRAAVVYIDAQSGSALRVDGWLADDGDRRQRASRKPGPPREAFWDVVLAGADMAMHRAAVVLPPGRGYVWHGYATSLGVKVVRAGPAVVLTISGKRARLRVRHAPPRGEVAAAWERSGELYLPVRTLLGLTDRLRADAEGRRIVLWHPYSRVAWRDWAAGRKARMEPPSPSLQDILGTDASADGVVR